MILPLLPRRPQTTLVFMLFGFHLALPACMLRTASHTGSTGAVGGSSAVLATTLARCFSAGVPS